MDQQPAAAPAPLIADLKRTSRDQADLNRRYLEGLHQQVGRQAQVLEGLLVQVTSMP